MTDLTIALAQIDPVLGDLRANIRTHCELARDAASRGAGLVVFPELSLTGYTVRDMNLGLAINTASPPEEIRPLLEASMTVPILAGGIEEDDRYAIYNAAFLFEKGVIRGVHRKVYLPTYGMFEEGRYFTPGSRVRMSVSSAGALGVLICEDLWHPSLPYLLALQGAAVIIGLVASPTRVVGSDATLSVQQSNTENHRSYARLLSSYMVFCNRVGFEDGTQFWGGSFVAGPGGSLVGQAALFKEELLLVSLRAADVRRARQSSRHWIDENPRFLLRELQSLLGSGSHHRQSDI